MSRNGDMMKLTDIKELLEAKEHYVPDGYDVDVRYAGACDLMSDVLAFFSEMPTEVSRQMMIITGLVSAQSIRTAGITDISLIVFSRGKEPTESVVEAARNTGVAILSTSLTSFTACGLLYNAGLKGVDD